jgi:oligopeptide transport system substrate-binding protein
VVPVKKLLCIFLAALCLLPLCACGDDDDAPENQVIAYRLGEEPASLDPQIADDDASLLAIMNLFEGLVRLDENGEPAPGVAVRWEPNADATAFTFSLRQDAAWPKIDKEHPESPVTAADFVFALQRALDPKTGSSMCKPLYAIKNAEAVHRGQLEPEALGVRAVNDYTLQIELNYSYPDFPQLMALPVAMPCNRAFFESTSGRYGREADAVLGNGPYHIRSYGWEHGEYLKLSRSASYRGEQEPVPAGVEFVIGAEVKSTVGALMDGTLDAAPLPVEEVQAAEDAGMHLTGFEDTSWGLLFNQEDGVFQNDKLRRGFLLALDRDYVLNRIPEHFARADDILPPSTTYLGEPYRAAAGGGHFLSGEENAKDLVLAGLEELQRDAPGAVKVLCLDTAPMRAVVNNLLEEWSRSLGYYLNMEPLSLGELTARVARGDYQIAFAPLRAEEDGPQSFLSMFSSQSGNNPAGLQSAEYDALVVPGQDATAEQALQNYEAAERYLAEQAVFYPLLYETRYFASAANVEGIRFHPYRGGVDFLYAVKDPKA